MHQMQSILAIAATLICYGAPTDVSAQDKEPGPANPLEGLRAEITAQSLYTPHQPIRLRFTLLNSSDTALEIPLTHALKPGEGIALPLELVLGIGGQPALQVSYEDEKPVAVRSWSPPAQSADGSRVLRLGPRGAVGADIDIRELCRQVRYSGQHRVEWRPLGDLVEAASVQFRVEARKDVILVTDYGKMAFSLMYDQAPRNVENLLDLVRTGFYDGKAIHRIVPSFTLQGGCPNGDGTGIRPDGKLIPAELHETPFDVGTLAMAHKVDDPNSASCQFFITLARVEALDGQYTVVGQTRDEESLRTLQQLADLPTDRNHHPLRKVVTRSAHLVDTELAAYQQTEINRP